MRDNGFIKVPRNLLTHRRVVVMMEREGVDGLGMYILLLLHLAHCKGGWGAYTRKQLYAFGAQARKQCPFVRRLINDYGLFVVEGNRFTSAPLESREIDS